ncbi:hypothetical protein ATER59S_00760 [Aquamicrobium terrae]
MALHPHAIRRAVLLRAIPVLAQLPPVRLDGARVLMVTGMRDPFGRHAPALTDWFRASDAAPDLRTVDAGHDIVADDGALARQNRDCDGILKPAGAGSSSPIAVRPLSPRPRRRREKH